MHLTLQNRYIYLVYFDLLFQYHYNHLESIFPIFKDEKTKAQRD